MQPLTANLLALAISAGQDRVAAWVDPLNSAMQRWQIDSPLRAAGWLATLAVESGRLRSVEENLNYTADGLCRVWPARFRMRRAGEGYMRVGKDGMAIAESFARNPQAIANRVYANRMGNGPEESGDGWRYRGRGPIQNTGRESYLSCGDALKMDLVSNPDRLLDPAVGSQAAGWFWFKRGINLMADRGDVLGMRKAVNGGTIGLDDFRLLYEGARRALGVPIK